VSLETSGGRGGAKPTICIHANRHAAAKDCSMDAGNKSTRLRSLCADADSVAVTGNALVTNVDVVIASGEIVAGTGATLLLPVWLLTSAPKPMAVFLMPVWEPTLITTLERAPSPSAVLKPG
jgi:hypothetical protein